MKLQRIAVGLLVFSLCLLPALPLPLPARGESPQHLQQAFAAAAAEFGVPEPLLLAVAYNLSRWEHHGGTPSAAGGYGIMHLTQVDGVALPDRRGDGRDRVASGDDAALQTLDAAANVLGLDPQVLKADPAQNLRGGAALLAQHALATTGELAQAPSRWYGAVAGYSGSQEAAVALDFADSVFATIRQGATRVTAEGQHVVLAAQDIAPDRSTVRALQLRNSGYSGVECPAGLGCEFLLAAYRPNTPGDTTDYGSFDLADRPAHGLDVRYIVIHDTEISYNRTVTAFQLPSRYVSAHYVIRARDGHVAQMVRTKNVAWHAGNWFMNGHTIGIEHEGVAIEGAAWYSEPMYRASARLVRYLAERYNIPLDRAHIIGHDEIPGPIPARHGRMNWDPGPFWDWAHYMELLGAPLIPAASATGDVVTIRPDFGRNQPPLTYCYGEDPNTCVSVPPQPANFVYLHTAPDVSAALIEDPYIGTVPTHANNWANKAVTGQRFYRAERQGDWDAIYFGGQKAWFHNPDDSLAIAGSGTLITPRSGLAAVPVYGRAYPDASAYPEGVKPEDQVPLYDMPAGQVYVAIDWTPGTFYYAPTYAADPAEAPHQVISGEPGYFRIYFNHRFGFVKAGDVTVLAGTNGQD